MNNALITGAAVRLGCAIARDLHHDHNVIVHYRNSKVEAQQLVAELNRKRPNSALAVHSKLNSSVSCQQLAAAANNAWGGVNVLVNNASAFYPTPIGGSTEAQWDALIESNLKAPFFLSQALAPTLGDNAGCIINMADIHGDRPMREHTIYCVAKAGLVMLTKSLARELAPHVRVNAVAPGAILWPQSLQDAEVKKDIVAKIPLGCCGEEQDIVRTLRFLVDSAPYISGQVIAVDGGRNLNI